MCFIGSGRYGTPLSPIGDVVQKVNISDGTVIQRVIMSMGTDSEWGKDCESLYYIIENDSFINTISIYW